MSNSIIIDQREIQYLEGNIILPTGANLDDPLFIESLKIAQELEGVFDSMWMVYRSGKTFNSSMWQHFDDERLRSDLDVWYKYVDLDRVYFGTAINTYMHCAADELTRRNTRKAAQCKKQKVKKAGYVYLLKSVSGHYKIGRTVNPDDRIATFSVKLPFEVEYEHLIKTNDMVWQESRLHKRFDHRREQGEWFNLSDSDVAYIKAMGSGV